MAKICGQLEFLEPPRGGGVSTRTVQYTDGQRRTFWAKHRMVFPLIRIGGQELKNYWVASDTLGTEIAEGAQTGDKVCLHYYGHLLTRKVIIGLTSASGSSQVMPRKGFISGLFWYAVFSPLVLLIPYALAGMLVGMLGGKQGTAMGLLLGVLGAVGVSWFSGFRLYRAYHELESEPRLAPAAVPASR
jgi:hypothetical protein